MNTPMQQLMIFVSEPEKYPEEPIFEHKYMVAALKKKITELLEAERQMVIDTVNDCWNCERDNGYIPVGEDYFNQKYKKCHKITLKIWKNYVV